MARVVECPCCRTRFPLQPRRPVRPRLFLVGAPGEPPDPLDVQLCLAGQVPPHRINVASRKQVVRTLAARGLTDAEIEQRTSWRKVGGRPGEAVAKFRARHDIPPGRPRQGWRYAS